MQAAFDGWYEETATRMDEEFFSDVAEHKYSTPP